jgi:pimeloyl-ACP methyl ester carboxylesterase
VVGVAEVREREIELAGLRSPAIESGPEAAEAAVFVHGNPGSSADWKDLAGRVGEFARALAFDLPGFGGCRAPRDFDFRPEGFGEFIGAALDRLGVERAHMVVHDLGGPFTWPLVAARPELVSSVVMINTGMLSGRRWHTMARLWRRPLVGEAVQLATPRRLFERGLRSGDARPLPDEFVRRMGRDYDRHTRRAVLGIYRAADVPYPAASRWRAAISELDLPALIVWGEKDPFVPERAIEHLRAAFPSAEVVRLPASGHFPFADDPDGTAAAAVPFLQAQLRSDVGVAPR